MHHGNVPRNGLTKPFEGYPAYGAVHEVVLNQSLKKFLFVFGQIADTILEANHRSIEVDHNPDYQPEDGFTADPMQIVGAAAGDEYDSRNYYRKFDEETLGISVVDMGSSAKAARALRRVWQKHDFGVVEQEARNEIDDKLPHEVPRLFLNRVEGVGRHLPGMIKTDNRQKLALMPDTSRCLAAIDYIETEAEEITKATHRRLTSKRSKRSEGQIVGQWDTVPHLTFVVFKQTIDPKQLIRIQNETNEHLSKYPFEIRLGKLVFRHQTKRGKVHRS